MSIPTEAQYISIVGIRFENSTHFGNAMNMIFAETDSIPTEAQSISIVGMRYEENTRFGNALSMIVAETD